MQGCYPVEGKQKVEHIFVAPAYWQTVVRMLFVTLKLVLMLALCFDIRCW